MQQPTHLSTRIVAADRVSECDIAAWAALESRAIEPNAYLSPHFVLPAARRLTANERTQVFFVENLVAGERQLVGVGVFTEGGATKRGLVPALTAYRSRHSLLGGLLLDRECPGLVLQALLSFVGEALPQYKAVAIPLVWNGGALAGGGDAGEPLSAINVRTTDVVPRAILVPAEADAHLRDKALAPRIRDLDRRLRRLRERGEVGWRCHRGASIPDDAVEAFLALEHMGWKGENGSSLRSNPDDEAFFREAVAGFASEGRVMFMELTLDGVPIASICNWISGNVGFGFKIGWNPAFRSASPAMLNELELMRHAATHFGDIEYFDSGASPSSYINQLWPARRTLATVTIPTGSIGAHMLRFSNWASLLRRRANSPRESIVAIHAIRPEILNIADQGLFALNHLPIG